MAANSARTLRPQDEISHYRIVGPLGAGGMGEVYLAQDQSLERNVALKILPPDLMRSDERVRRFVLEAKSASSLSHPNIVTIHEIGRDAVRSPGEPESSPVHFISMELVNGKTLSALIHEERTELRKLIGWLAQAADGIAKAHAAGIVHRDLKPGNIMVTADGFAKVLDFGLAKLTERGEAAPDATSAPTVAHDRTSEGLVVGTAGYMAPEQVQGRGVDHRADIFSFGCILYEAATRRRAFAAESSIETLHQVLHENPAPIEEINPKAPSELRRLIRRCLQKSPEQRLQSMKDLALELREIEAEYESLSASGSSGSVASAAMPVARRASALPWIVTGVVVLAAVAVALWAVRRNDHAPQAFQKMRMTTITSTGDAFAAALSPDGRYLAFISQKGDARSLSVRQVATGSDVAILPPGDLPIDDLSFSPDGNYLFYTTPRPDRPSYRTLYQVPSLGGAPSEVTFDVDSRASFSPDGSHLVFRRHVSSPVMDRLIVLNLGTRQERVLAEVANPEAIFGAPAWSPDGRRIAALMTTPANRLDGVVAMFDAESGRRTDWLRLHLTFPGSLAWVREGTAVAISGEQLGTTFSEQITLHPYPGGRPSRVTNDFRDYVGITAALAEEALAAVRVSRIGFSYLADAAGREARRLTSATGPENTFFSPAPVDTSTILYSSARNGMLQIWAVGTGGEAPRAITGADVQSVLPQVAAGLVVFDRFDSSGIHVWTMSAAGGSSRKLTSGAGEQCEDLSDDGRHALVARYDSDGRYSVISTADGSSVLEFKDLARGGGRFSPDSRALLAPRIEMDEPGLSRVRRDIVALDGGTVTASVRLPTNAFGVRWTPDGAALSFNNRNDRNWNVFRQPIAGGAPVAVTRLTDGRVLQHEWSPDGRRLAYLVRSGEQVDLWVADAAGGRAVQVTRITSETVSEFQWMPDSRRLLVEAATHSSDVVLIRDFR